MGFHLVFADFVNKTNMNILSYYKYVNRDSLKKEELKELDFAVTSELFYNDSPNKSSFILKYSKSGFFYHRLPEVEKELKQENCSFNIPPVFAKNPCKYEKQNRPRRDKHDLYEEFFSDLINESVMKKNLRITLHKFLSTWKMFFSQSPSGTFGFWGMAKGTPRYNRVMHSRIIDMADYLQSTHSECFILSPTVDPKTAPKNKELMWLQFNEKLGHLCKHLSRAFDAKIIVAIEAQRNLNPHAHLLIFTNRHFTDIKHRYSRSGKHLYICGGALREAVTACWGDDIADLQECNNNRAKWYLSKYVAKETEADFENLLRKEKWTTHDIKDVATCLLPMLFGIRQFRLPKLRNAVEEYNERKNVVVSCEEKKNSLKRSTPPTLEERSFEINREAVVLDCVRNKSPLPCIKNLFCGNYADLKSEIGESLESWNEKEEKNVENVTSKCQKMGCSKCAFGLYLMQCLGMETSFFKKFSIFDFFGNEIENLYKDYAKSSVEERKYFSNLKSSYNQKLFLFAQMPSDWTIEEKENVFLQIEYIDSCLWQFVLSPKYTDWAVKLHLSKRSIDISKFFDKKSGLAPKTLLSFFPLTYSASGYMIIHGNDKGGTENE